MKKIFCVLAVILVSVLTACGGPKTYTLTYTATEGGSIQGEATQTVEEFGNGKAVTAVADEYYLFLYWSDGITSPRRTDIGVEADVTVQAVFGVDESAVAKRDHAAFLATADGEVVTVTGYIAAKQGWWNNQVVIYLLDVNSNGYYVYNLPCTEEQNNTDLAIGNHVSITGTKGSWAGEVEILGQEGAGATYTVLEGTKTDFTPIAVTLADNLEAIMNGYFTVSKVEVVAAPTFQNDNNTGDIYFTVKDAEGNTMDCCIESYLTGTSTDVYQAAAALQAGDVVTLTGYMYWYNGANPHITKIAK